MSDSIGGFAIRRKDDCGSLKPCGEIISNTFFPCCPEKTECFRAENTFCCPEGADSDACKQELNASPRCANPAWDMYNNPNDWRAAGYFCCDSDLRGYNATGKEGSDGCARVENGTLGKDDKLLNVEVQAKVTPSASESTTSTTAEPSADDDDNLPIGAIAGGTVGGVAALAILIAAVWWFRRRKRRAPVVAPLEDEPKVPAVAASPREVEGDPADGRTKAKELHGEHGASELPA